MTLVTAFIILIVLMFKYYLASFSTYHHHQVELLTASFHRLLPLQKSIGSLQLLTHKLIRGPNPRSSSNLMNGTNSPIRQIPARIDAVYAHQDHRLSAIERYVREVDQYNARLGGKYSADSRQGNAMTRYVSNWEHDWNRLSMIRSPGGEDGSFHDGGSQSCQEPFRDRGSRYDNGSSFNEDHGKHGAGSHSERSCSVNGVGSSRDGRSHDGGSSSHCSGSR